MADEIKKPTNMLEALERADKMTENSLVSSFRSAMERAPEMSIGSVLRLYHFAVIKSFQTCAPTDVFSPTLGLIAKCLLPHLTDEEKEALRNVKV